MAAFGCGVRSMTGPSVRFSGGLWGSGDCYSQHADVFATRSLKVSKLVESLEKLDGNPLVGEDLSNKGLGSWSEGLDSVKKISSHFTLARNYFIIMKIG